MAAVSEAVSKNRKTADALVKAFMDFSLDGISAIIALRTPDCQRHIIPASMGIPPQSNTIFKQSLQQLLPIFGNFSLVVHDLVEDVAQSKIVMWLSAKGDTKVGEYVNEYMWILEFNEDGMICKSTEFVDSVMQRDFWPRLKDAMDKEKAAKPA